jgi:hypothetical protein
MRAERDGERQQQNDKPWKRFMVVLLSLPEAHALA